MTGAVWEGSMDFTNAVGTSSGDYDVVSEDDHHLTSINDNVDIETNCWGCGLRVLVSPRASIFKCGWCGAITKENAIKSDQNHFRWRRLRDRCFVGAVLVYMLFFICGGIWAIHSVLFSISYIYGVLHLIVASLLAISTLFTFCLAAFQSAGAPPMILYGSYPAVGKNGLENYSFCHICSKPKSRNTHHCRSCGTCVLDMDHHCPFIGNCVGASNHKPFILFLISTVISSLYVAILTPYTAFHIWPPIEHGPMGPLNGLSAHELVFRVVKENIFSFLSSMVFLPARGLLLVYLFIASVSVGIGLSALLWQQMSYIYVGKTYLSQLNSQETEERDCGNIVRFFGCRSGGAMYLPSYWKSRKSHRK